MYLGRFDSGELKFTSFAQGLLLVRDSGRLIIALEQLIAGRILFKIGAVREVGMWIWSLGLGIPTGLMLESGCFTESSPACSAQQWGTCWGHRQPSVIAHCSFLILFGKVILIFRLPFRYHKLKFELKLPTTLVRVRSQTFQGTAGISNFVNALRWTVRHQSNDVLRKHSLPASEIENDKIEL